MKEEFKEADIKGQAGLFAILAILIIVSALGGRYILNAVKDDKKQETVTEVSASIQKEENIITEPKTEEAEKETKPAYVSPIDFDALREKNPDIIAWIRIPETNIDYPVLWNGDNEFYLYHDMDKKESKAGAIFLDGEDRPDFSTKHNIIYGHNMKNKSMFQNIVKFKDKDFFEKNRDIYIYTKDKEYHLRTITALYTDASGEKRQTKFGDEDDFKSYVNKMTGLARFRDLPEKDIDRLWSFITCSYEFDDARTILYAYELDKDMSIEETNNE